MAGLGFGGIYASDDDMKRAEFMRMLAENEDDWLSVNACRADASGESPVGVADEDNYYRSAGCSDASSPTVALQDDDGVSDVQFESAKVNPIQRDTTHSLCEIQELRAQNDDLKSKVDQLMKEAEMKPLAYGEAQMRVQVQGNSPEMMENLAHDEIQKQVSAQVDVLRSKVNTLQYENQQLQQSTTAAANIMNRLDRFYTTKDSDKEQIQRLSEERLRLSGELFKTVQAQLKTVEVQLDDKVDEVETLKCKLATMGTLTAAQSEQLSATCADLYH
jgi:hypothetical protein